MIKAPVGRLVPPMPKEGDQVHVAGLASAVALLAVLPWSRQHPRPRRAQKVAPGGTLVAAVQRTRCSQRPASTRTTRLGTVSDRHECHPGHGLTARVCKTLHHQAADVSKGGKVFTFQMDPNTKFCDGTGSTADDIYLALQARECPKAMHPVGGTPKGMKIKHTKQS